VNRDGANPKTEDEMTLTEKERHALQAIVTASEATTGTKTEGWWSNDILIYAKECPLTGRQFAAVCGTLAKKGLVRSQEHEPGQSYIYATNAGIDALST
jgi:hypothetical protein